MVRPVRFRMNEETVVNNYFQEEMDLKNEEINRQAQQEFDALVHKLREVGVKADSGRWYLRTKYSWFGIS